MSDVVEVGLWGTTIGHLGYSPGQTQIATFEYDPQFLAAGIAVSPLVMAAPPHLHFFPALSSPTFKGLPGIFADSLPDRFGNRLIDIYMAERNIPPERITSLDRLLYVGTRGMGALEYHPAVRFADEKDPQTALDIHALSELVDLLAERQERFVAELHSETDRARALRLIRVGSSAGGARSKALVARSPQGQLRDGTLDHGPDHTYWLLKFDSEHNQDKDGADPPGMTRVEYVYSLIARECGITMPRTELLEDAGVAHFLIERFDRFADGGRTGKLHYASWAGIAHADRDPAGAQSCEQLVLAAKQLSLGQDTVTELFRRAVFNIVGRNQDDHTKNCGFLMDKHGRWRLAPAFDMTYSYDPAGMWTRVHQTRLNRKLDGFTRNDLLSFGSHCNLPRPKATAIIEKIREAFSRFEGLAREHGVQEGLRRTIADNLRMGV